MGSRTQNCRQKDDRICFILSFFSERSRPKKTKKKRKIMLNGCEVACECLARGATTRHLPVTREIWTLCCAVPNDVKEKKNKKKKSKGVMGFF